MVFPKQHSAAVHADHAAHVHKHFDLSILGMGLEGWIVLFVIFAAVQARRSAARRGGFVSAGAEASRPRAAVRARVADVRPPGEEAIQERLSVRAADTGVEARKHNHCAAARAASLPRARARRAPPVPAPRQYP